ncbi:hypothetical protein PspLS_05060, partial [Pyricularia sp. CBS 133598]
MIVYHEELRPEISCWETTTGSFNELQMEGEVGLSLGAGTLFFLCYQFVPCVQPKPLGCYPFLALPRRLGFGLKGLDRCILMRGQ